MGTASYRRPRRDQRIGLRLVPRQGGVRRIRLLERRHLRPQDDRHQLLVLPQRQDRTGHDHAAAPADRDAAVLELPHQHGGELHHLHDEPRLGVDDALRRLSQRCVHQPGHQGRAWERRRMPGHVATNGSDCASCHAKAVSGGYASWSGGTFAHKTTDTNCSSCHNGKTAKGMTTPPHLPTGTLQCSNCHTNTASSFTTYTMNHASVSTSRCDACHIGRLHQPGHQGRAGNGVVCRPRRDQRIGLRLVPRQGGVRRLRQLGRRHLRPQGDRHQLLVLPQRQDRKGHDDAAAPADRHAPVHELPHQHGGELHHLHDEPRLGVDEALRLLSHRRVHQPGHQGRDGYGVVSRATSRPTARLRRAATPRRCPADTPPGAAAPSRTRRPTPTARPATTARPQPA